MTYLFPRRAVSLLAVLGMLLCVQAADAQTEQRVYKLGALTVTAPWTRATPKGADVAGGYLAVTNSGTQADRLVGGSVTIASRFEIHAMATTDGVMKMRYLDKGLEIKPGETVELKPGGLHIMMTGLNAPVKQGDEIKGTLVFEKAGTLDVEFTTLGVGAGAPASGHEHAH